MLSLVVFVPFFPLRDVFILVVVFSAALSGGCGVVSAVESVVVVSVAVDIVAAVADVDDSFEPDIDVGFDVEIDVDVSFKVALVVSTALLFTAASVSVEL